MHTGQVWEITPKLSRRAARRNSDWVDVSTVCAGPLKLGRLHGRHMRIEDEYGRLKRLNV